MSRKIKAFLWGVSRYTLAIYLACVVLFIVWLVIVVLVSVVMCLVGADGALCG
jgi:hypothetical protein